MIEYEYLHFATYKTDEHQQLLIPKKRENQELCTSQWKNATQDYCNLAKMIKPESDKDSESSCQFTGNAEDRGGCWTAPNAQNQQNLDWGKFCGPIVPEIFNRLNFKKNKVNKKIQRIKRYKGKECKKQKQEDIQRGCLRKKINRF